MKYKSGDVLYYVCPFVFIIEKVNIEMLMQEEDGTIFYIDRSGAYLREHDLFDKFKDAQIDAFNKLNKFYHEKRHEILNSKPKFSKD